MTRLIALIAVFVPLLVALAAIGPLHATRAMPVTNGPAQTRSGLSSACRAEVTQTVSPDAVRLCDTANVAVTLAVTCPTSLPVHLVIAIDRSKSMADPGVSNRLINMQSSARNVVEALDFANPETKVGVVSHGFRITVETDLTNDRNRAITAINRVRWDQSDIGEDPPKATEKALQLLEPARIPGTSPIEIIILYGDGCDPTVPGCPVRARAAGAQAKSSGAVLMTMCYPESDRANCNDYRQMATSASYYFEAGSGRLVQEVKDVQATGTNLSASSLSLLEALAPGVEYLPNSAAPNPVIALPRLTFTWTNVRPGQMVTATYRLRGRAVGTTSVRTGDSAVTLMDSLDRTGDPIPVPPASLTVTGECVVETPTPTASPTAITPPTEPPTSTPPATPTPPLPTTTATTPPPTPTATSVPGMVYLPILLRQSCKQVEVHSDVILAIDASQSMAELTGSVTKLAAAQTAARQFIDQLALGKDQAGIITFNATASLEAPLSNDHGALMRAIDRITTAAGTRIDLALEEAYREFKSSRVNPANNRVLILMTDGRPDAGTSDAIRAAAARLKALGVVIYTIGFGSDVDPVLLIEIATSPSTYLQAPDAAALAGIYAQVAGELPCPGGVVWGGP